MPAQTVPDPADYRFRRVVVAVAAATAVVLGPTACDVGTSADVAAPLQAGGGYASGQGGHAGHGDGVVGEATYAPVPVNAVEELGPSEDADGAAGDGAAGGAGGAGTGDGDTPDGDVPAVPDEPDVPAPTPADPSAAPTSPGPTPPGPTATPTGSPGPTGTATPTPAASTPATPAAPTPPSALQTLGGDCTGSDLAPHDGFQNAPRCVSIAFGEVASEDRSPSLLITEAPTEVGAGENFTLQVSTRNLVRDRFLGAAAGGYYRESSFLNDAGIQRGHFHTACRLLADLTLAPDAQPAPAFFLATQDNGGGAKPDQVRVPVTGLDEPGTYQCAVWAGDGSHRLPMMQRANQTPAFDAVRITVG